MIITSNEIKEGDVLAEPAITRAGQVLLGTGTVLTAKHKRIFKERGVVVVEIRDDGLNAGALVDDATRELAHTRYTARLTEPAAHPQEIVIDALAVECLAALITRQGGASIDA